MWQHVLDSILIGNLIYYFDWKLHAHAEVVYMLIDVFDILLIRFHF